MTFEIPGPERQTTIVGKNGSGKTQAGAFLLSRMGFDTMSWVIFDFKREALFAEIDEIRTLDIEGSNWHELGQPGLFIVRPKPGQHEEVEALLWHIWEHEEIGVFIDEGYMIKRSPAFEGILTQGRAKYIPRIILSQRPAWISKFVFSEADYIQIFRLSVASDRKTVQENVEKDLSKRLPQYYSYWYDVNHDELTALRPVPDRDAIIATFRNRLKVLNQTRHAKAFV